MANYFCEEPKKFVVEDYLKMMKEFCEKLTKAKDVSRANRGSLAMCISKENFTLVMTHISETISISPKLSVNPLIWLTIDLYYTARSPKICFKES